MVASTDFVRPAGPSNELISRAKRDKAARRELFTHLQKYHRVLLPGLVDGMDSIRRRTESACDLQQTFWARSMDKFDRFHGTQWHELRPWLYVVARYIQCEHYKRAGAERNQYKSVSTTRQLQPSLARTLHSDHDDLHAREFHARVGEIVERRLSTHPDVVQILQTYELVLAGRLFSLAAENPESRIAGLVASGDLAGAAAQTILGHCGASHMKTVMRFLRIIEEVLFEDDTEFVAS